MRAWVIEISDFLPQIDGDNRLYRAGFLANALVGGGHEVLWWSSTFNHQLRRQRFSTSTTIRINDNYSVRLLYGPGYQNSKSITRWMHNRIIARGFAKEVSALSPDKYPDIVYACLPTLEVSEQAVLFGKRKNIPVVIDIREQYPDNYLKIAPEYLRPTLRFLLMNEFARVRRILGNATAITASSDAYLQWGLEIAKRKAGKNDRWFPLCPFIPPKGHNEDVVLPKEIEALENNFIITFVGALSRLNLDFESVVRVAHDLNKVSPDVHFVFIGEGEQKTFLQKHAEQNANIHVMGWCNKPVVDRILASSSIGLAPYSLTLAPTLPNKPFEYMAAGLPLLSSLEGELKIIIEQEKIGLHYNAYHPDSLKGAIRWFLAHPEETKVMGQRAKALFIERFNTDSVYSTYVEHLNHISMSRK